MKNRKYKKMISLVTIALIIIQLVPIGSFADLVSASSNYQNVALGKPASASSFFPGEGPELTVDGSRDFLTEEGFWSNWASEKIMPQSCDSEVSNICSMTTAPPWVEVDLESPHTIDRWVVVGIVNWAESKLSENRARSIVLKGSLDKVNYFEIGRSTIESTEVENYSIIHEAQLSEPVTYQYFRVEINEVFEKSRDYYAGIGEIELYGTPVLEGDTTPPTIANDEIRVSNITTSGAKLNWNSATDDKTKQQELEYQVYQSTSNNIDTVSNIEANGTPLRSGFSTNLYSFTVTGLTPNTPYYFNVIVKDAAGNKTAYAMQQVTTKAIPVMDGTVAITGNAKFGEMLVVDFSGISYTPPSMNDVPTYQWYRDGVAINGAKNLFYTLVKEDIGKEITVTVTADGTNATGSVTSEPTSTVVKANGPNAPNAPVAASKNTTSITLVNMPGQEYSEDGGITWQDSSSFNGLTPNTSYTFVTRVKETATHFASASSASVSIETEAIPVIGGTVTITGDAKFGSMLTADISGISYSPATANDMQTYQWERNGVAINGATSPTYTLVEEDIGKAITVTVSADGVNATGSVTSNPTSTIVKADGPNAPNAPVEANKDTTSITLVNMPGQEYSIDGGSWQDSPNFNGLSPNTDYTFVTRIKETATHFASANSASKTIKTSALPVIGGTVTITGNAKFGSMLTADISGISYSPATANDVQTYQWERDGVAINGATNSTYTLVQDDIGKAITVTVSADGVNATGSVTSSPTNSIAKADGPNAPTSAPVEAGKNTTSITLGHVSGLEYSKDGGHTWQDSSTFTGLTPNTSYTFVTRMKETPTQLASASSPPVTIKTEAIPVIGGTVTITGDAKFGSMLTADITGISYTPTTTSDMQTFQWERDGVAINGATNLAYTLVEEDIGKVITVTVSADGVNATGSVTSDPTSTIVKADGPNAPNAPDKASKNTTSITLLNVPGQEYSIDGGITWQDSPTFNGLTPNTSYTFVTRMKETATHLASTNSTPVTIKTEAPPVSGGTATIGGTVTITGNPKFGQTLTANISGISYSPTTTNDVPTFQWKRNGVAIHGATSQSYTLVQDDIGKVITFTITADGINATGSVTSSPTSTIVKADGPNAPNAPVAASKNTTSITLVNVLGQEYSMDNGISWQDSPSFNGLTPNTSYTFVTRVKETATHFASASSAPVTIKAETSPVISGTVTITGNPKFGQTLTANIGGISYSPATTNDMPTFQWKRDGVAINSATSLTYTLVEADIGKTITFTITADGANATGSVTSNPTSTIVKADGANAPNAPVEASKNTTSITLVNVLGQEYSMDNGISWQDSPSFNGLTPNTSYTFVTRVKETATHFASASSAPVMLKTNIDPLSYIVTYIGNNNTTGTVPTDANSYKKGSLVTVSGNTGHLEKTGYIFAGWNTQADGNGTNYVAGNIITIETSNITLYAKWIEASNGNDGTGTSDNNAPSTPSTPTPTNTGVDVLVNGKAEKAGTATTNLRNEQTVTTIAIDEKKLDEKLEAEGQHAVVTIPVNTKSDVVVGELNGQMVKNMENKQAVLEMKTERATYTLPAKQININAISEQFGKSIALEDIKVQIEIGVPSAEMSKVIENVAETGTFSLVVPPLEFTISCTFGDQSINLSTFNAYVERIIAIPDDVDPNKITTGVVVDLDGTVRHVPTKITQIEGKYYAVINSLTNSIYSVVWHPLEFSDVANHWAKNAVNNMGSRMVVDGTENGLFSPDKEITRAEFAAIIVRGLGLKPENGATPFSDVKESDWYNNAINTAYEYQLINGFEDHTFRPNDKITREQAMVIIDRAMQITELKTKLPVENAIPQTYLDQADASIWAQRSIADCLQAGIVLGRNSEILAPKDFITRAEVAMIMERLLQKSNLI